MKLFLSILKAKALVMLAVAPDGNVVHVFVFKAFKGVKKALKGAYKVLKGRYKVLKGAYKALKGLKRP